MKRVVIIGIFVVLVLGALLLLFRDGNGNGLQIKLVKVERGAIAEKALAVGTIEPEKEIRVKSTISGIVAEIYFKVGDHREAGQPLFKISPNPTPLEYASARRSMEMAMVSLKKVRRERERQKKLYTSKLISRSEMEELDALFSEQELRYQMAREKFLLLEKGRITMANKKIDSIVASPISGIVLSQEVFEGDPVVPLTNFQPGTELCAMADMGDMLFKGTVDEIDVGKLQVGMPADIQVGALPDSKVAGKLERISPKARKDGNSTLFDIEVGIVPATNTVLRAGYSATAYVIVQEKKGVLLIPERLVIFEGETRFVEVQRGEEIEKKEIQTGLSDGLQVEVVSGLKEGEEVVERPPREIE